MARELKDIQTDTFNAMLQQPTLVSAFSLDPTKTYDQQNKSATALWYLIMWIGCYIAWVLETLFDNHEAIVLGEVAQLKPHSKNWYKNKVLNFMYGYNNYVVDETGEYNLVDLGLTDEQITLSKIITHVAIEEQNNKMLIKVARNDPADATNLVAITDDQKAGLVSYLQKIKDCGVFFEVVSRLPDIIRIPLIIYYDSMILNSSGFRVDSTSSTPVHDVIKEYLKTLNNAFDARFIPVDMIDAVQKIEGVKIPVFGIMQNINDVPIFQSCLCQWKDSSGVFQDISAYKQPFSGYFTTMDNGTDLLNIIFIPYN